MPAYFLYSYMNTTINLFIYCASLAIKGLVGITKYLKYVKYVEKTLKIRVDGGRP